LALEHWFRTTLSKPVPTSIFLAVNGVILLVGERLRRRAPQPDPVYAEGGDKPRIVDERDLAETSDHTLSAMPVPGAVLIGSAQIAALAPGISRSGITMVAGLLRGLSHEDAARFSFLLATPVILAAGLFKLPDLAGPLGTGVRGQVLFGSVLSGIAAYLSVRFLTRYYQVRSLVPFGIYCLVAGLGCLVYFA
jgi:undecaprenyl-diphosphatase